MSMEKYNIKTTDTDTLKRWYHLMVLGRALDEKAPSYLLQSLGWSYHAPYAGHDGIQLAIGQVFRRGEDFLFPYYRDMLTVLSAGMSVEELILNGISKATDPSSGGPLTYVSFTGGCNGNLKGISSLVTGMDVETVISKLEGTTCNFKPTSCPDQLAQALKNYLQGA